MLNTETTRRDMLKLSAMFAGAATVAPAMALTKTKASANTDASQKAFISALLLKHAKGAKSSGLDEINAFAERFTEVNGVVDYQGLFSNIDGEFRLARAFVKSLRISKTV